MEIPVATRVLVVDDEAGMRTTLAANLELEGYEVVEAESGQRAVALFREQPFELVITDIQMPGLDGVETLRELRKIRPKATIVMMTGFAMEQLVDQGIAAGAYTVLEKPFAMDAVMKVIARAAAGSSVLVVDDIPDIADAIVASLQAIGLRAEAVHDGESAVRLVRDRPVDICVLDLVLPGEDSIAICERLLDVDRTLTVIAMTAYPVDEMIGRIAAMGSYTCLRKPFAIPALIEAIAKARGAAA
jgi:two-component system, NtrC family, response regulator HydG